MTAFDFWLAAAWVTFMVLLTLVSIVAVVALAPTPFNIILGISVGAGGGALTAMMIEVLTDDS